ncbi:MAG: methyltransferase domain-containing protein [Solirubrobacteraceae bacterium]
MPRGTERFLDSRSLSSDHRQLAQLIAPGLSVLDVGCGSGAITRGIAEAVGPAGSAVGVDVSEALLEQAVVSHGGRANLSFELADVLRLEYHEAFDLVTTARMLQWLADPAAALASMVAAVKPGGKIVVLDYSHTKARWKPEPPAEFTRFYEAFLRWRADAGMDNELADKLGTMLREAGMRDVEVTDEAELTSRGDADFERRMALWPGVIATRGHQIVADGMLAEHERAAAGDAFARWLATDAQSQSLYLLAATATKPPQLHPPR